MRILPIGNARRLAKTIPPHWTKSMARQILFTHPVCVQHQAYATGYRHEITYQGEFLHWHVIGPDVPEKPGGLRGECNAFSPACRLRMITLMASIDWRKAGKTLFVTLTFPDRYLDTPTRKISQYLHVFRRHVEKYLKKQVPIIWRLEWMERKSGPKKNHVMPHFHLLMLGVSWIPYRVTNQLWKATLGYKAYCRTETTAMRSKRGAVYYMAKYAAKLDSSLVHAAYLNIKQPGRQWGVLRRDSVPMCEKFAGRFPDDLETAQLYEYAKSKLTSELQRSAESFRLFGDAAIEIGQIAHGTGLDGEIIDI